MTTPPTSEGPVVSTHVSKRVRQALAAMLVGVALIIYLAIALILATGDVPWLWDFEAYYLSAERFAAGGSLYTEAQLAGPFDAVCDMCFLYPPPFGQLLVPFTVVPLVAAKTIWFVLMMASAWLSVWLALSIGGAKRTVERAAWSFVAVAFFLPTFHSAWMGNVGTLLGLLIVLVALGGAIAGVSAALATVLKVSPGPLVLVALATGGRSAISVIATLAVVVMVSFVLAPKGWADYPTVLMNMVRGGGEAAWNLAPVEMAIRMGIEGAGLAVVRLATLVAGLAAVVVSVWVARKPGGLPLAVLLATVAMLAVPGTLWYHYLSAVLPLVAMAWPRASRVERVVLVAAAALTTIAGGPLIPLGVAFACAVLMLAIAGRVMWATMPNGPASPGQGARAVSSSA
jgi:hypothetical protein